MDINDIMYVHIDRRRKLPVTSFLKALGCSKDGEILSLFREEVEEVIDEELVGRYNGGEDIVDKDSGEGFIGGLREDKRREPNSATGGQSKEVKSFGCPVG